MPASHSLFDLDRRRFLEASIGACALSLWPRSPLFAQESKPRSKAKAIIVLYMAGGPSHIDTFDPKPGKPTGGAFKAIPTAVKGLQISEHLPRVAKIMDKVALLRSMSTGEGNHRRASYMMKTGYAPQGPVSHPGLGALMSRYKGKPDFELPNFVSINSASEGGGFLGVEYSPFVVNDARNKVDNLARPSSVDKSRFKARWKMLEEAEGRFAEGRRPDMVEGHRKVYEAAERFMHSKLASAFDVSEEPEKVRAAYGEGRFGQGCLMARRLVEVGVPFIEVTLGGWDTHTNNFDTIQGLSGELDPAFSSLIRELDERKLLDDTIVLWTGDFGRTPRVNARGGRDHFPRAWSSVIAGGGIPGGALIGDTGATGEGVEKGPAIKAGDLFATIAALTGIDPAQENYSKAGRPIRVIDKDASAIKELL